MTVVIPKILSVNDNQRIKIKPMKGDGSDGLISFWKQIHNGEL